MTPDLLLLGSACLTGLMGGLHCAAMCGGIATGFSAMAGGRGGGLRTALEANLGRILGYGIAGAIAGGVGHGIVTVARFPGLALGLRMLVGAVLVVAALRLLDRSGRFALLTRPARGALHWLQPLQRRLLPARSTGRRLLAGMLWGWLPCGLSTTVLAAAWLQAQALGGALTMLAFGLGTLPVMLPLTWSGQRLAQRLLRGPWRLAGGALVLLAGVTTLIAPWLARLPAAHRVLGALGCGSLYP